MNERSAVGRDETRVIMERADLEDVPCFGIESPYRIRSWKPGDEASWFDIHVEADPPFTDPACFVKQFGDDPAELAARQWYLCDGETVIGTASAWHESAYKEGDWGRVHWVAIRPAYQGKGLAKPLLSKVLAETARLGHRRAYLTTQRFRTAALHLYASFGFVEV